MKKYLTTLFVLGYCFASAQIQLTDFSQSTAPRSSTPTRFFHFNNNVFFTARTEETGMEIWKTNGTATGTTLLKDINIGSGSSFPSNFVELDGKMYFVANDDINGFQLWSTDGSEGGTVRVSDNLNHAVNQIVSTGDLIYFLKKPSNYRLEIWKSDGTQEGTSIVKGDVPIWNSPANLTAALGLLFFTAQDEGSNDSRLWRTDGTEAGTFPVAGPFDGNGAGPSGTSEPTQFIEYNGALYFIIRGAFANGLSVGIVKTDGTIAGTSHMLGMYSGNTNLMEFADVTVHNNKMYFSFFDMDANHLFIWESQGSAGSTKSIYDYFGESYFAPSTLQGYGDYLYFSSGNSSGGTSLTRLEVATLDTEEVKQLAGPIEEPFIFSRQFDYSTLVADENGLFIQAVPETDAYAELWRSDGSPEGTSKLGRMYRLEQSSGLVGNKLFYSGSGSSDYELWTTDGTATGTVLVKDINTGIASSGFGTPYHVGDGLLLTTNHPDYGQEFLTSDGTIAGTSVLDLTEGKPGTWPFGHLTIGDKLYFLGLGDGTNLKLFASDGTTSGTKVVKVFNTSTWNLRLAYMGGDNMFAFAQTENKSYSLYSFNKETGVGDAIYNFGLNEYNVGFYPTDAVVMNNTLYFLLAGVGVDLWKSDGTAAGTVKVADLSSAASLTVAGSYVYFTEQSPFPEEKVELYKSDGTAGGTGIVKDINGALSSRPENLTAFNGRLLFTAREENSGKEVWITDGTESNTRILKDINEGSPSGISTPSFAVRDDMVFFMANSAAHGAELWKSDGTEAGTTLVKDIVAGSGSSKPSSLSIQHDELYFSAFTPDAGSEVWTSDGTEEGTRMVVDVIPGPIHSNPRGIVKLGDNLVFVAGTESNGVQLWSFSESVTSVHEEGSTFSVYPNPSSGIFNLDARQMVGGSVAVFNAQGQCVLSASDLSESTAINLSHLSAGLYVMKIAKGRDIVALKVVKR